MLTAWLMYHVSPNLSGNFNVFDYAGNFPRWMCDVPGFSRKGLRDRIRWANNRAINTQNPSFKFKIEDIYVDFKRTHPANASKDRKIRPWDIPLIAWEDKLLIPTHWKSLPGQIHREATYRMDVDFARNSLPYVLEHGRLLRSELRDQGEIERYLAEPSKIWVRLKEVLERQHKETRRRYDTPLKELDRAMHRSFREEAKVAFLAFSVADFRPKYRIQVEA
jgi:hypothetical protein